MEELARRLRDVMATGGMALVGVASSEAVAQYAEPEAEALISRLPQAISMGYRLSDAVIEGIEDGPTLIYKHHYKTVNWLLDQTAARCAAAVQSAGYDAVPVPASQTVDWERQVGLLSHRIIAHHAGLGWIGRSTLVVNPIHGARVRYATVLTDAPLDPALLSSPGGAEEEGGLSERIAGGCGECERCIPVCPAGAISREGYDRERCLATLREFARRRGIGVFICGVCVKACPVERPGRSGGPGGAPE